MSDDDRNLITRERAVEVVRSEIMRHKLQGYPLASDVMELLSRILDRLELEGRPTTRANQGDAPTTK